MRRRRRPGSSPSGTGRTALVVGSDHLASLPHPEDRTTAPLFGDGAGAMLLRSGGVLEAGALGPKSTPPTTP
ncbi:hypothetical protein [Streptomyces sp. NPDC055709]